MEKWKGICLGRVVYLGWSEKRWKGVDMDFNWDDFSCKGMLRGKFKIYRK